MLSLRPQRQTAAGPQIRGCLNDITIVGAGPARLTAAVDAGRTIAAGRCIEEQARRLRDAA